MRVLLKPFLLLFVTLSVVQAFAESLLDEAEGISTLIIETNVESFKFETKDGRLKYPEEHDLHTYISQVYRSCGALIPRYLTDLQTELDLNNLKAVILNKECSIKDNTYYEKGNSYGAYQGIVNIKFVILEKK